MRILSIAAAAVLLAAPGIANAKNTEINLEGFCDLMAVQVNGSTAVGFSDDSCEGGIFAGSIVTVRGTNTKSVLAGFQFKDQPAQQYVLRLDYPLHDGGLWSIAYTTDGYQVQTFASGKYKVWGHGAKHRPKGPKLLEVVRSR
ncbi:MAG: hypothetical protein WDM89_15760 [Rhizomicrobium sp.]